MSLIDQQKIDALCVQYSQFNRSKNAAQRMQDTVEDALAVEMRSLQTLFRRSLTKACRVTGYPRHPRVWPLIAHGKTPVTITPIASATVFVRVGVEIHLSFVATEATIAAECKKLAVAISAFNSAA